MGQNDFGIECRQSGVAAHQPYPPTTLSVPFAGLGVAPSEVQACRIDEVVTVPPSTHVIAPTPTNVVATTRFDGRHRPTAPEW